MNRVIIALSSCRAKGCDFSYSQVHVAFSRVRQAAHIRLLLTGDNEAQQWGTLTYIPFLTSNPRVKYYFKGYRNVKPNNPNQNWMENSWSAERANKWLVESNPDL